MTEVRAFVVPGSPRGWQRPGSSRGGRRYTPARTRGYERDVAVAALAAGVRPVDGPIAVHIAVHADHVEVSIGSCRGKVARPDLDNIAKAVLDGLSGVAYADDAQVVELHVRRRVP